MTFRARVGAAWRWMAPGGYGLIQNSVRCFVKSGTRVGRGGEACSMLRRIPCCRTLPVQRCIGQETHGDCRGRGASRRCGGSRYPTAGRVAA